MASVRDFGASGDTSLKLKNLPLSEKKWGCFRLEEPLSEKKWLGKAVCTTRMSMEVIVTIVSKLGYNLFRGLTTYIILGL